MCVTDYLRVRVRKSRIQDYKNFNTLIPNQCRINEKYKDIEIDRWTFYLWFTYNNNNIYESAKILHCAFLA